MQIRTIASVAGLLVSASLAFATSAQAAPFYSTGYGGFYKYPAFPYEGGYPEATPCGSDSFKPVESKTVNWGGFNITLTYFYSDGCGSYARIDNAPRECAVYLDRTPFKNGNTKKWAYVKETVDANINYAYTQVGNNLEGRLSRGALLCNGTFVTNTKWY